MLNGITWIVASLALLLVLLYIAKKKGKFRLLYVVLTLLAPPLGIFAVLLSKPEVDAEDQTNPSLLAKLALGLLPLWAAIALTVLAFFNTQPADFWNAAPWYITVSIPVCCMTLMALDICVRIRSRGVRRHAAKPNA